MLINFDLKNLLFYFSMILKFNIFLGKLDTCHVRVKNIGESQTFYLGFWYVYILLYLYGQILLLLLILLYL